MENPAQALLPPTGPRNVIVIVNKFLEGQTTILSDLFQSQIHELPPPDFILDPSSVSVQEKPFRIAMALHEQYILKVTAGATYDTSKHEDVHVNTEKPVNISSEHLDARIQVRVKDYRGMFFVLHYRIAARDCTQTTPRMALRRRKPHTHFLLCYNY